MHAVWQMENATDNAKTRPLTEFERRVMRYIAGRRHDAGMWEIAQWAFPEKWSKTKGSRRSGRGALIAHLRRACMKLDELRLVCFRNTSNNSSVAGIPHGKRWDDARQCLVSATI